MRARDDISRGAGYSFPPATVVGHYVQGEGGNAMTSKRIYRVIFFSQGQVYEIYAHKVGQGDMMGFVEVEKLSFGERSEVLVDPSEERLKSEFEGVERTYIPMHAVIRIDEVEKLGAARITEATGNVTPFPLPGYNNPGSGKR